MKCQSRWSLCSIWSILSNPESKTWRSRRRRAFPAKRTRSSPWRISCPGTSSLRSQERLAPFCLKWTQNQRNLALRLCLWESAYLCLSTLSAGLSQECLEMVLVARLQLWRLIWWYWMGLFCSFFWYRANAKLPRGLLHTVSESKMLWTWFLFFMSLLPFPNGIW